MRKNLVTIALVSLFPPVSNSLIIFFIFFQFKMTSSFHTHALLRKIPVFCIVWKFFCLPNILLLGLKSSCGNFKREIKSSLQSNKNFDRQTHNFFCGLRIERIKEITAWAFVLNTYYLILLNMWQNSFN